MSDRTPPPGDDAALERRILHLVGQLVAELRPGSAAAGVNPDDSLERDLGLSSLEQVELLSRIERATGVRVSDAVPGTAETPADLVRAVLSAEPGRAETLPRVRPGPGAAVSAPDSAETLVDVLEWHAHASPDRPHIYTAGGRRLREDPHLRLAVAPRGRGGRLAAGPGHRPAGHRRDHAADRGGLLPRLLRHAARRSDPGPRLSPVPPRPDRRVRAAAGAHPVERGSPPADHLRRDRAAGGPPPGPGPDAVGGRHPGRARAREPGRGPAAGPPVELAEPARTRPSSSTRPAAPASRRGCC